MLRKGALSWRLNEASARATCADRTVLLGDTEVATLKACTHPNIVKLVSQTATCGVSVLLRYRNPASPRAA